MKYFGAFVAITLGLFVLASSYSCDTAGAQQKRMILQRPVPPPPPDIPVAIAATGLSVSGFTANWDASSGATSYRLDVAEDNGFAVYVTNWQDKTVVGTSDAVTGLDTATSYYYRVRAVNDVGTSGNSNTITATTSSPPDTAFKLVVYGQVWAYQEFTPAMVAWTGIDYHILFQETSVLENQPYHTLIGSTSDSTEYENGRGGATSHLGQALRDSLHAHSAKHLITIFAVYGTDPEDGHPLGGPLDTLARDSTKVQNFANNLLAWMNRHGVDGTDLDWENSNSSLSERKRVQRILYNTYHPAGKILVNACGRFDYLAFEPAYVDFMIPQYYSWDQVYSGCIGGSYNVIAYSNALQIGTPDPCPSPSYIHGAGLRDSLRLTGWSEPDIVYHGGPGSWQHYGWPKNKVGAGYGAYGTLFHTITDTVVWTTVQNGWNHYSTSIRLQDIRKTYAVGSGIHYTYDASREAWSIRGRPGSTIGVWPANQLGFMTVPNNDNVAKWTRWLADQGYASIMVYGMYEDYQPDSANGSGRFGMIESIKRELGRIP